MPDDYECVDGIEVLSKLCDERGLKHWESEAVACETHIFVDKAGNPHECWEAPDGMVNVVISMSPEQAVEATLGPEPTEWSNPEWERWHKSLRHEEVKTIGDAVEQLMYEAIEFGGDMGPNGNVYQGIDEGDVLTSGFINSWIEQFESTLGRDKYTYEQFRKISDAIGDAMEYAHDKAIEHPDKADPLWNLDEYVNRVLDVAFNGAATLGSCSCSNSEQISGTCQKVYLVETSDDLIESWHPIGVYLNSEAAEDCAEALRGEVDGIRQFARVVELKVVDE